MAVVGNAPLEDDRSAAIDAHDVVLRFNKAPHWHGRAGSRLDVLVLVNHGGQMREWLEKDALHRMAQVEAARLVVLPIPFLDGHLTPADAREQGVTDVDRINYGHEAHELLQRRGRRCRLVDRSDYTAALHELKRRPFGLLRIV